MAQAQFQDDENPALPLGCKKRRTLLFTIKAFVSACLIIWIMSRADLSKVFASLSSADPKFVLAACGLQFLGGLITATRWRGLLRAQAVRLPLPLLYKSCLVANFVRQFLPSTIGGDAVRVYDSWKGGATKAVAVTALTYDRLTGLLTLVLMAVVALSFEGPLTRRHPALHRWMAVGLVALLAATMVAVTPWPNPTTIARRIFAVLPAAIRPVVEKILDTAMVYRGQFRTLGRALALSVLMQVNVVTFYFLIALALGFGIPYHGFYAIVPIAIFVMLLPVAVNGIGIREGVFVLLLGAYGIDNAQAIAFAWLEYGVFLFCGLAGGVIYALRT